jgi:hypothetical protein
MNLSESYKNRLCELAGVITPTVIKLINTAEKDGYLQSGEGGAGYIIDAAKLVAQEWDELNFEEKRVFRDVAYKKFLKLIHKTPQLDNH